MAYGVLIVLVPPCDTWPKGWEAGPSRSTTEIEAWRTRLTTWERGIEDQTSALGARSVLSFTPLYQPAIAQTNVWLDNVGDNIHEAMQRANQLAIAISEAGHIIRSVQILDWLYNPS